MNLNRKQSFWDKKIEVLKRAMNFVQKLNFLLSLFFTEIMFEKIFFEYFK